MEPKTGQIHQCLQKLIGLHRQLLDTVRMEREALVGADLRGIQEATAAKEALIEAIRQADHQRAKATAELAILWKKPMKELSLSKIIIEVQGQDKKSAESLRSSQNALALLVQRITEANQENRRLVGSSLEHIQEMKKNVIQESASQSATYSPQGQKVAPSSAAQSRLISQEA